MFVQNQNNQKITWILVSSERIFAKRLTKRVNLFRKVEGKAL